MMTAQRRKAQLISGFLSLVFFSFSANAFAADDETKPALDASNPYYVNPKDPYEKFNRPMYKFNDILDRVILKPIATVYNKVLPKPLNKGISNFFSNINNVPTVINDLLQGNIYQATSDTWRLAINSTVGLLGFFDVAANIGLEPNYEDFGLTLARWGWKQSNYLVLPFLGPSSVRDGVGIPITYYYMSVYPYIYPVMTRNIIFGTGIVARRADLLRFQSVFEQAAVDKYTFIRDAYMQRRAYLIERNKELGDPYLNKDKEGNEEKHTPPPL